jgi:hypothetical protein
MPSSNKAFEVPQIRSGFRPEWRLVATLCVLVFLSSCSAPPPPAVLPKYDLQIAVLGLRKPSVVPRESFRISSGQINVGCGDTVPGSVQFAIPQGATDVQARASWQHTDNLRNMAQTVSPPNGVLTAAGTITGLERQFFNCPGGGHGELVLEGSYIPAAPDQGTLPVLKTVHDQVASHQPLLVRLPVDATITPSSCDVVVSTDRSSSRATIKFAIDAQGKLAISEIAPNSTPMIDASIKDNVLTISVRGK